MFTKSTRLSDNKPETKDKGKEKEARTQFSFPQAMADNFFLPPFFRYFTLGYLGNINEGIGG